MEAEFAIETFRSFLVGKGLKWTKQRAAIAESFFATSEHLSLQEILDVAKLRMPSVGYATVFRTMKLLHQCGLAVEHKFAEDNVRYEVLIEDEHHDHLICVDCGRIVEVEDPRIEELQEQLAHKNGFKVVGHRHEIYGSCLDMNCSYRSKKNVTGALATRNIRV